jgi:hypothetical protein
VLIRDIVLILKLNPGDMRVGFPLRLPAELREQLERAARESHRSINGEIVFRLERSLREKRE